MFALILSSLIIVTIGICLRDDHAKDDNACNIDDFFRREEYNIAAETTSHGVKAAFMIFDLVWLSVSTRRIWILIKKHSNQRHFMTELRKLAFVFWSFILVYLLWQVYYIIDLKVDIKYYNNGGYWE